MTLLSRTDRLVVRKAGAWTKDKLHDVERYAGAFTRAMTGKWDKLTYIDLLSGPGRCLIRDTNEEIEGSPMRALNVTPPFDHFYFADKSKKNIRALRQRIPGHLQGRVICNVGDCNRLVAGATGTLTGGTLALAFLDPQGMEVAFATLATLADHRVNVLYLFPSGIALRRNVKHFLTSSGATMDRFWGGPEWRDLLAAGSTSPHAIAQTWVEAFRTKAKKLGLLSGESAPLISNDRGSRMYHLLFFSKNKAGLTIWNKVMRVQASGQRLLL